MKEKFRKQYLQWFLRLILRLKLNGRNKIMAVNTWVVSVMRCSAGILKWNSEKLKSLDRRTRKVMIMNECMEPYIPKVMLIGYILEGKWEEGD